MAPKKIKDVEEEVKQRNNEEGTSSALMQRMIPKHVVLKTVVIPETRKQNLNIPITLPTGLENTECNNVLIGSDGDECEEVWCEDDPGS